MKHFDYAQSFWHTRGECGRQTDGRTDRVSVTMRRMAHTMNLISGIEATARSLAVTDVVAKTGYSICSFAMTVTYSSLLQTHASHDRSLFKPHPARTGRTVSFRNLRLQSCVIKQTTVQSMRSEHGLSTILHCLQWYKLVLRTRTAYWLIHCKVAVTISLTDRRPQPTRLMMLTHSQETCTRNLYKSTCTRNLTV